MDLKQLKYFMHVAELGSYTRAAEYLNVAQPILSRQIRQLETELRRSLLIRHGRGVQLTEAGSTLLRHCRQIDQQIEQVKEDLSIASGKITGRIVLGVPPTVSRLLSVDIVKHFRAELPDASISISEGLTANLQEQLQLGRIHVALLNNPGHNPELKTRLINREHLYLIAPVNDARFSKDKPITADLLATLPLIMPRTPNTYRTLFEREMARLNQKHNIVLEIDSIETTLALVAEEMGYAILSPRAVSDFSKKNLFQAVPLRNPILDNHLFLAISAKHAQTRLQKALLRIVGEVCAAYFPPVADGS
ncbi:MAG: LysR family transcriptional regulator [Alysiella sp.]|uniref:LysR family transcriptional regulator n=1 Tax=Alysiella sp. TaxID=1872483 RepID=UPI0026DC38B7|nr:LysR family transcriptional regulator [Alysiella sp.]MDO4433063.1 LysR family transcriptional regulator [Alysiella sp.]